MNVAVAITLAIGIPVVLLGVVVLVVVLVARDRAAGAPRVADLPSPGVIGWAEIPPDPALLGRCSGVPLNPGRSNWSIKVFARVRQALQAQYQGRRVIAFLYGVRKITVGSRIDLATAVVSVDLPFGVPLLLIAPVPGSLRDWDRLAAQGFDRVFTISTQNTEFSSAVLSPAIKQWLLTDPRARLFPVQYEGQALTAWAAEDQVPFAPSLRPELINPMAGFVAELANQIPHPRQARY
jgi:hypothetical protein